MKKSISVILLMAAILNLLTGCTVQNQSEQKHKSSEHNQSKKEETAIDINKLSSLHEISISEVSLSDKSKFFDFSEFIVFWHVYNILSYFILIVFIVITVRITVINIDIVLDKQVYPIIHIHKHQLQILHLVLLSQFWLEKQEQFILLHSYILNIAHMLIQTIKELEHMFHFQK